MIWNFEYPESEPSQKLMTRVAGGRGYYHASDCTAVRRHIGRNQGLCCGNLQRRTSRDPGRIFHRFHAAWKRG
jgi:hypothetical protein